jgi:magnesium-transporting ATPase (P-type)
MTDAFTTRDDPAALDDPSTPDTEDTPASPEERGRSLRRAASLTAIVGIVFALLFILAFVLMAQVPNSKATDQEIIDYYSSGASSVPVIVGLYVLPFGGIAFLWFIVTLRMWEAASARRLNALQSNLQLVSGILFVALFFVGAATSSVVAVSAQYAEGGIDPGASRQFSTLGSTLIIFFSMRMAAMFVFTTSSLGRSAGILPRWFGLVGFGVGLFLLLSAAFTPVLVLSFPAWVLALCLILLRNAREIPKEIRLPVRNGRALDPIGAQRLFRPDRPASGQPDDPRRS